MAARTSTRIFAAVAALSAAPLVAACFYDFTFDAAADAGDAGDAGADAAAHDATTDANDGGGDEISPPPPDNSVPPSCKTGCGPGFYCAYPDHQCGRGLPGSCAPVPTGGCSKDLALFCSCNGTLGKSDCEIYSQGMDLDIGGCKGVDPMHFQCGWEYCPSATAFCQEFKAKQYFACVEWSTIGCDAAAHDCTCAKPSCTTLSCNPGDAGLTLSCGP